MGSKTVNYQLNQWEADDSFLRTDFNEDNAKIDAALKAHDTALGQKADSGTVTASLNALNTAVSGKCEVVFGSYYGDNTTDRTISLGFRPKAVFLISSTGKVDSSGSIYGGLASEEATAKGITLSDTGFAVSNVSIDKIFTNTAGVTYNYAAFR